jgi:hypothetical protein
MNNETETTTMDPNDPKRWTQRQRQRKWTSPRFANDETTTAGIWVRTKAGCRECGQTFDVIANPDDGEWLYGHDCEAS